jgi:hypothetical protein
MAAATLKEETKMHSLTAAMPGAQSRPAINWQRVARPISQVAAVLAITATLIAGINAAWQGSPTGSGGTGSNAASTGLAPSNQTAECAAQPPSADRLASVLEITGVLTGSSTDFSGWVSPSVTVTDAATLPAGHPVVEPTQDELSALWAQFVACGMLNDGSEYGFVSDDGLRRAFFQTAYIVTSAAIDTTTDYSKLEALRTEPDPMATPEAKPTMEGEAPITTAMTTEVAHLVLGAMTTLEDGRIVAALEDPSLSGPEEFEGLVVFIAEGDGWLIDDFYAFQG